MSVAFLAMSNHIKITHSADFFIELLRDFFGEVVVIAHEDAWLQLPGRKWDLIVVWQKRYKPEELEAFGADRVVLVPMYDDIPFDESYWGRYRSFKILCFSRAMERMLLSFGLQAWGVRYYPEIPKTRAEWGGFRGFFWPRIKAIDWALVKRLVGGTAFDRMHVHWTGGDEAARRSLLAEEEAADSNVELSSWVSDPSAYRYFLEAANVFFAPRLAEGIGLSFIEAMALGQCVIAADRPTMNEYIQDLNGFSTIRPLRALSISPVPPNWGSPPAHPARREEKPG